MATLTVEVNARRAHYTTHEILNLKDSLKRDGEKYLLVEDVLLAREQRDTAIGALSESRAAHKIAIEAEQQKTADERKAKEVDRYVLKMYKDDEEIYKAALNRLYSERDEAIRLAKEANQIARDAVAATEKMQAERNLAREQLASASDQVGDLTDKLIEVEKERDDENRMRHAAQGRAQVLGKERDEARALFVEVVQKYVCVLTACQIIEAAANNAVALAEHLKQDLANVIAERDEIKQQRDALGDVALRNKALGEKAFSERDEALACARREICTRIFLEIERDHARECAIKAIENFGLPTVIVVPFAGEQVASYGEPDDEQECACGQRNSDEPCDAACAKIEGERLYLPDDFCACVSCAADARNEAAKQQVNDSVQRAAEVAASEPADDSKPKHFDAGKLRFDIMPPEGEAVIAGAFSYGAKKYGDRNWEKAPGLRSLQFFGSMRRHLNKWRAGEDIDPESGEPHLAHVGANCMMLIATLARFPESDNR